MKSQNHPIILFIDRFGFSVYQDTLTNIPKFNFTPDLVSNLDVVSKEKFVNLITTFIQINKIVSSSIAVILSDNIIYIKDLAVFVQKPPLSQDLKAESEGQGHKDEIQDFLEDIPFEEILAKVIKTGNADRIVAVNKDLVMAIVDTFVSKGAVVEAVIPSFMYGQNANFATGLTLDNVRVILENAEILKSGNLLTDQERMVPSSNLENELKDLSFGAKPDLTNGTKKPQNLRQYILIGVFVTLLVILAVVYLNLGVSQSSPKKPKINSAKVGQVNTAPTVIPPLAQESITTVPINIKTISIRILHSALSSGPAANLKNVLMGIGFQNVLDEVSEISIPEKSSVIFSQSIPADVRNNVITEIKKILPGISILENQDANFTIAILIGRS